MRCRECGTVVDVASLASTCTCGGLFDIDEGIPPAGVGLVDETRNSLWRYASALPVDCDDRISLGEGMTPLVRSRDLPNVRFKLDLLLPTLSFKDRGAVVLATLARRLGVESALTDSSGNAGTAAAAYLGRAQIPCRVFVPESTSPVKLAQMRAHGAEVVTVPGSRADTAAAAGRAAAVPGVFYASHVYHPYFMHGVKTFGYELWEQNGRRLPEVVVVPVGNGTLLLGAHLAFRELVAAGLAKMPTLVAVQARGCAPVAEAFGRGADAVTSATRSEPTVAEGIAISHPPRGAQILAAVRETGGTVVSVSDEQIVRARADLAEEGLYVEPTSAVCWAAVRAEARGGLLTSAEVVVPLCGAGAKSP
ncbi:threonine synthase [Mycolicibacterium confluentis]|nr:threonine synthase [Mycolicibacterium confluentis]ORV32291.1 threonine synthase [Mycolicibacterium confluentis]